MLHEFLSENRAAIIARTRIKVSTRFSPQATEEELARGIPLFLDQLTETLRFLKPPSREMEASASMHGRELLTRGFSVAQVVHDYGDLCQAVTELAGASRQSITVDEFQVFNRCLDDAIAQAVTEYMQSREKSITEEGNERLGNLSHELRNSLGAAMLAFQTLKTGSVGIGGSTAAVLDRSLRRACAVIDSSVAQVRLESGVKAIERVSMREFIEEVEVGASMEASAQQLTLTISPVAEGLNVSVDRQLLGGALSNLLQNAFKFTRPASRVSLDTVGTSDRVRIAVSDECGGLPPGKAESMFRPFVQQGANRTGLGLGLSISQRSVQAIGGELGVRDIPGTGCVFTIDLPRL